MTDYDPELDAMASALWAAFKNAPWDSGLCPEGLMDEMRRDAEIQRAALDAYRSEQEAVWAEGVRAIADAESNSILEGYAAAAEPDWENATSYSDLATGTITPETPRTQVGWYHSETHQVVDGTFVFPLLSNDQAALWQPVFIEGETP